MLLIIGLMAIRTGYFITSRRSSTPFERAVMTYCLRNSSSSVARRVRTTTAVPAVPMTRIGIGRCLSRSHSLAMLHGSP